jgi:hypothetical protein
LTPGTSSIHPIQSSPDCFTIAVYSDMTVHRNSNGDPASSGARASERGLLP